jgi:uncharacterized protein DUF4390
MTFSSMRCCRRLARHSSALLRGALLALWLAVAAVWPAHAQGIDVRKATVTVTDDALVLEAQFDITLTHTLEEVLNKGVALYFLFEFELIRPRWYWFNERVMQFRQDYRLSYNALTRQYRVGVGNLHQNFGSLAEALDVMSRVRRRQEVDSGMLRKDTTYIAGVRLQLETSQLPKPFQLNALGSRNWYVGSDWYRWAVTP